ncbi:hypothetical protein LTR10_016284 [Elasticomyces elasticus]|uniref:Zinc-regulated transporter 1 n=1 Tax=Exophiala sideris TaxID=1016849 RepID=A0ABR0J5L0_9EURO|nr:hypothetical protein LTR10_016284 [Elasticomyces elasticus]KAK5028293.1 hypothetical protein LTS07_006384 [Exophiala sideris]KAK5036062.1 hypothetical protein LTR13_005632 [Exophiala sideris]KAK5057099.1 hypothetical protein LTR69_007737 [Exophiala sideris]KAK5181506.1 hypothetical protein LTR44_006301 [Eurotiomycetes sp. CCFEE 6388]
MSHNYPFGITNPSCVDLDTADPRDVTCYIQYSGNDYNGDLGARISSVFVILIISSAVTFSPVLATRVKNLRIPLYVYLFARYFGTGVIIATGFIHLLDPSYYEIGMNTCVGMTGSWSLYSWPPAIALSTVMLTFLMDFIAERCVEKKYGISQQQNVNPTENDLRSGSVDAAMLRYEFSRRQSSVRGSREIDRPNDTIQQQQPSSQRDVAERKNTQTFATIEEEKEHATHVAFRQQIAAFLILEFGIIFHSVIIGLTLGSSGPEFSVLYPVIVFHQSFEGLGIGARLSAIPFPKKYHWMPWWLCAGYGLTTPIAIAIGLGIRTTYNANSYTVNVVAGLLDSISAGILIYTGLVELMARDFLFSPERTNNDGQLAFMAICMLLGAGLMALLGKWA